MGFGFVLAGLILLFNPVIIVYDVIPDAAGFLLIILGLTKMSYFFDRIEQARKFFSYLLLSELLKYASVFLIVNRVDSGSTKLLLTFIFSVGEAALFVPAVIWLFEGLSMVSLKYNGTAFSKTVTGKNRKTKDISTVTRNHMIGFYIFRSAATLLPELTELQMYDHVGTVARDSRPLTDYKMPLYRLLSVIVLILGIVYIVRVVRFFGSMKRDSALCNAFISDYEDAKVTRKSFFLAKRMKFSLGIFTISVLTSLMLIIDNINILIGAVSAVFLIVAVLFMRKYSTGMNSVIIVSAVRIAVAVLSFILQIRYFDNYSVEAVEWVEKAARQYYVMASANALEHLLAFTGYLLFVIILVKDIREHLKICGIIAESAQYSKKNRDRETMKSVVTVSVVMALFALIACASGGLFRFIVVEHEIFIVLDAVLEIIFAAYGFYYVGRINNLIYDREE